MLMAQLLSGDRGADTMKEESQEAAGSTWKSVWSWLGTLSSAAVLVSLIKSRFSIELYRLPAMVYEQYVWLRDMLFEPADWVLQYFALSIPAWLKDILLGYALIAAAHVRGLRTGTGYKLLVGLCWPLVQVVWWLLRFSPHWEDSEAAFFNRRFVLLNLLAAILSAITFFLWNYLQNIFGPGG